VNTEKDNEETY